MTADTQSAPALLDADRWQPKLEELLARVGAPGALFAIMQGDEVMQCAAGVANLDDATPIATGTLFHIASISKVFTATLVMQLVDEGKLDLDEPIRTYLPDFRVADAETTDRVTARNLLSHTSGIDGDKEDSFGRGDDALGRYVDSCATLQQVFPLGATFSYCNSGFNILGRVVEVLRDKSFDAALREHLFEPLGMRRTGTLPEDIIWFPVATGHRTEDKKTHAEYAWEAERSHAPAGGVITTASDLLAFARMHVDGGVARDGTRILSQAAASAMLEPAVEVPDPSYGATHWGLGWELLSREGAPQLMGHGGDLLGHHARMWICPSLRLAVVLLVNGDGVDVVADPLFREALGELGVTLPPLPVPPDPLPTVDLVPLAGTYETVAVRLTFEPIDDRLVAHYRLLSEELAAQLPESMRERDLTFVPVSQRQFLTRLDDDDPWSSALFYESNGDRYVHLGLRAMRARDDEPATAA
jgi:CubicO group peptidase (beta-lactamase class C family)